LAQKPIEEDKMAVTMYHNPRCNTSRRTLALLREKGVEPNIIEYLKTPYTVAELKKLLGQLKMPASALVRKKEAVAAGIDPKKLPEAALIEAMVKNPIIVERPIVVSGEKAALGRPPEAVLAVL
jgi:arsenate reductase (glutaredoxin)